MKEQELAQVKAQELAQAQEPEQAQAVLFENRIAWERETVC